MVPDAVRDILRGPARVALVGASEAPEKYGHIIHMDLASRGYTVLPVNPRRATVNGHKAFSSLAALPGAIDIVNVVVPPHLALKVARMPAPAGCTTIWFQPGAFDEAVVKAAQSNYPTVIAGDCIMVVARTV